MKAPVLPWLCRSSTVKTNSVSNLVALFRASSALCWCYSYSPPMCRTQRLADQHRGPVDSSWLDCQLRHCPRLPELLCSTVKDVHAATGDCHLLTHHRLSQITLLSLRCL